MQPRGALAVPWLKWLKVFVSSLRILPFKTRGEEIKLGHDFVKINRFGKKMHLFSHKGQGVLKMDVFKGFPVENLSRLASLKQLTLKMSRCLLI